MNETQSAPVTAKNLFGVGCTLLGLWFFATGLITLPVIFSDAFQNSEFALDPNLLVRIVMYIAIGLSFIFGWKKIFKLAKISND